MPRVKKKQASTHEDFAAAFDRIESLVSPRRVELLAAWAVGRIRSLRGNVAFAWSGGKDSIVLQHLATQAGVEQCVLGRSDLEYPAFVEWVESHKPPGLEILNCGWDLEWIVRNPHMLFPVGSRLAARWYAGVQRWAQAKYAARRNIDVLLLGNRRADGNYVGVGSDSYLLGDLRRFSPLAAWTHEDILGFLHFNGLRDSLPPIYAWPRGFRCGTHSWARRSKIHTIRYNWAEIWTIDQSIVIAAATRLDSARQFLENPVTHDNCPTDQPD